MKNQRLHGDVITGMPAYHELDHQLVTAGTEVPGRCPEHALATRNAGDDRELTGDQADLPLHPVRRPAGDVQREVLRALLRARLTQAG